MTDKLQGIVIRSIPQTQIVMLCVFDGFLFQQLC